MIYRPYAKYTIRLGLILTFAALALSHNGYEIGTFARDTAFVTFGLLVGSIAKEFEIVVAVKELKKAVSYITGLMVMDSCKGCRDKISERRIDMLKSLDSSLDGV